MRTHQRNSKLARRVRGLGYRLRNWIGDHDVVRKRPRRAWAISMPSINLGCFGLRIGWFYIDVYPDHWHSRPGHLGGIFIKGRSSRCWITLRGIRWEPAADSRGFRAWPWQVLRGRYVGILADLQADEHFSGIHRPWRRLTAVTILARERWAMVQCAVGGHVIECELTNPESGREELWCRRCGWSARVWH